MKKPTFKFTLDTGKGHELKDGSYPIVLYVRKQNRRKNIYLNFSAEKGQWNYEFQRYIVDKRKTNLHPDCIKNNLWLDKMSGRCDRVIKDFEERKIDWTLNQFEQALIEKSKNTGIEAYFLKHIDSLSKAGKIGNKICYQRTLDMLKLYDSKFGRLVFNEIDLKYVKGFHNYLHNDRECSGNTIKYYIKTLRSLLNNAIRDGEATSTHYPFGKTGYSISQLTQETHKRYLPNEYIEQIKAAQFEDPQNEVYRNLFLFSYYLQGMSFVDIANLTSENIFISEGGKYIVYRRQKTEGKNSKFIRIQITDQISNLLSWFKQNTKLIGDHLAPVISIEGYEGEQLYNHIRNRYKRYNSGLKSVAEELKFEGIILSSYVSRHSYAMRLKNSGVSEDVISEALGHKDLKTTKVYLDSFGNGEIDKANKFL